MLIVDEGHQIKNPSCQSGRSLRRINARSRILLTGPEAELGRGQDEPTLCSARETWLWQDVASHKWPRTPLQNKLSDLWALMDFAFISV